LPQATEMMAVRITNECVKFFMTIASPP